MPYATLAEFKVRTGSRTSPPGLYEQMTDRVAATTANDTIGQALLDDAESVVNQKLALRYAFPVDTGDSILAAFLKRCTIIIATFHGWGEHPKLSANRENVKTLYDEVMKVLSAIATGDQDVPATTPPTRATTGGSPAYVGGMAPNFDEDSMKGM